MRLILWAAVGCLWSMAQPAPAAAQLRLEVTGGALVGEKEALVTASVAPALSLALHADVGIPLVLEAGAARADFTSFGQAFHRYYGFFFVGAEWMPVRGAVHAGLRLGVGAEVEDDTSEDDPGLVSSSNWASAVVPALVLRRRLSSGRELSLVVSDHVLGPVNAIFDPQEYSIQHRVRVLLGIRY